jgi:hypothetical protein
LWPTTAELDRWFEHHLNDSFLLLTDVRHFAAAKLALSAQYMLTIFVSNADTNIDFPVVEAEIA